MMLSPEFLDDPLIQRQLTSQPLGFIPTQQADYECVQKGRCINLAKDIEVLDLITQ